MKALSVGLVILVVAMLAGAGCRTTSGDANCPKCKMPKECCTCGTTE